MNIENKIKTMIEDKVNEKSILDYKVQEYNLGTSNKWEMIKDIIAMLNSEESFGEDKFIILGVAEREFYIKGLEQDMRDDNEYQNLLELITPRPKVETGQVFINDKTIGYIFIDKNNIERPYTFSQDNEKYCKGSSFIRKGSINVSLDNEEREKMILEKYTRSSSYHKIFQDILNQNAMTSELIYKSKCNVGTKQINPSNNNGKFIIGTGLSEFNIKFDVANNGVARIYNHYGIQVAKIKGKAHLFDTYINTSFEELDLDFSNNSRRYTTSDLAVIVNKMGKCVLITFLDIESESHGANSDLIEFKWKVI